MSYSASAERSAYTPYLRPSRQRQRVSSATRYHDHRCTSERVSTESRRHAPLLRTSVPNLTFETTAPECGRKVWSLPIIIPIKAKNFNNRICVGTHAPQTLVQVASRQRHTLRARPRRESSKHHTSSVFIPGVERAVARQSSRMIRASSHHDDFI